MALFVYRHRARELQQQISVKFTLNAVYSGLLKIIDRGAHWATCLQQGKLRTYLVVILTGTVALFVAFGGFSLPLDWSALTWPSFNFRGELAILRVFVLFVIVGAALASVLLRNDLFAIIASTASGLGIVVLMVLEPAPDVALVQIVVDILSIVILVLALARLPRLQREKAQGLTFKQNPVNMARDVLVALAGGIMVMLVTLSALLSRPRQSIVTPFYTQNAKPMVGSKSIVGAIITDFRGLDTLIEIGVIRGLAVLILSPLYGMPVRRRGAACSRAGYVFSSEMFTRCRHFGIGGLKTWSFIRLLAYIALPVAMVMGPQQLSCRRLSALATGFRGVIMGLSVGFWYVVFGYE